MHSCIVFLTGNTCFISNRFILSDQKLSLIVRPLFDLVFDVVALTNNPAVPRQLLNAMWTFELARVLKFCSGPWRADTTADSNCLRRPLLSLVCTDGEGGNILAAQGLLIDEKIPAFASAQGKLLPLIIPVEALRAATIFIVDDCKAEKRALSYARERGVFSRSLDIRYCTYHLIDQELIDLSDQRVHGTLVLISSALHDVVQKCERRTEALITLTCVRAYSRRTLRATKFQILEELLDKLISCLIGWAFFAVLWIFTLLATTTSPVEGFHSLFHRATNGGLKLGRGSSLHAVLDKINENLKIRAAERDIAAHDRAASVGELTGENAEILAEADKFLTKLGFSLFRCQVDDAKHYSVTFIRNGHVHWRVVRRKWVTPKSIGPQFQHVRIVVLCRGPDGQLFLLCSCFYYQRMLLLCRHIVALKNQMVDVFEDVWCRYHIAYATQHGISDKLRPSSTDGQFHGPGLKGVPNSQVAWAVSNLPKTRDGVQAWLDEGGLSHVPNPTVVWSLVSEAEYVTESGRDLQFGYSDDDAEPAYGTQLDDCIRERYSRDTAQPCCMSRSMLLVFQMMMLMIMLMSSLWSRLAWALSMSPPPSSRRDNFFATLNLIFLTVHTLLRDWPQMLQTGLRISRLSGPQPG
jgi:hypothetical protein